jgi:hypothetical protein
MEKTLLSKYYPKLIPVMFLLWWISMPFQSKLFGISIGFLTIYPNLIISLFFVPFIIQTFSDTPKQLKGILFFLFFWIIYGIVLAKINGFTKEEIFDTRVLILQFLFAIVLIVNYVKLGINEYLKITIIGLKISLFIYFSFGFFEFLTGIHFSGSKTNEMLLLPVNNNFYAPMFIFDNQNTFLTYLIASLLLLNLLDRNFRENLFLQLFLWLFVYLFAVYADSTFAKWIVYLNVFTTLINHAKIKTKIMDYWPYGLALLSMIILFLSQPKFLGPLFENSKNYRLNQLTVVEKSSSGKFEVYNVRDRYSSADQKKIINDLDSIHKNNPEKSDNLRKSLILLGFEVIKENPILGAGPAGYSTYAEKNKERFKLGSQRSAHFFPIEIISQYGIFAWIYFLIIAYVCFHFFANSFKNSKKIYFEIAFFISFGFLWLMPSGYLLLEINRLFLPLLAIVVYSKNQSLESV